MIGSINRVSVIIIAVSSLIHSETEIMHRQRECLECEASDSPQWRKGPAGSQT